MTDDKPQDQQSPVKPAARERLGGFVSGSAPRTYSRTYSRFVRMMRLVLPLAAVAIVLLLFSWPRLEETMAPIPDENMLPRHIAKNELLAPHFQSRDEKNQPFNINASRAVQSARDPDLILLERPEADMTLRDGTWLAAAADRGAYQQKSEILLLEGSVRLFHDLGYELKTEKLTVSLEDHKAWSDAAVYAQGPAGTLEATGLQANSAGNQLIFTGPARLVLNRALKGL